LYRFELTERGKIALAVFVAAIILVISVVLAVSALRNSSSNVPPPDTPPNISVTDPNESPPEPPENGGFPPPPDDDEAPSVVPPETPPEDKTPPQNDNSDTPPPVEVSSPSLNLSTGKFTFFFSLSVQTALDRETGIMLDKFLTSPKNIRSNLIAIETPKLSSDDSKEFMSVMTSELGYRNVSTARIVHIIDPEIPLSEHIEVTLYYMEQTVK